MALGRVVEHVQDVLLRGDEERVQRQEPAILEVLALIHDDRVEPAAVPLDGGLERIRERVVEPGRRNRVRRLRRERAGLAPEVLAQLVERGHGQQAGRGGRLVGLGREHPGQRGVEADQQRAEAFAGESSCLLHGQHGLAGPGAPDDARPTHAAERVDGADLAGRQPDDLTLAFDQLVAQHRMQLDRRRDEVPKDRHTVLARRPRARTGSATLAAPDIEGQIEPTSEVGGWAVAGQESTLIEDEVRVDVGPEGGQTEATAGTREIHARKRDGMAGCGVEARLPGGQFAQLLDQVVVAGRRLRERRGLQWVTACPPSPVRITTDLAGLHLEDQESTVRVRDDEVRLAFDLVAAVARDPADIREDDDAFGKGAPDPVVDEAFGLATSGLGRVLAGSPARAGCLGSLVWSRAAFGHRAPSMSHRWGALLGILGSREHVV